MQGDYLIRLYAVEEMDRPLYEVRGSSFGHISHEYDQQTLVKTVPLVLNVHPTVLHVGKLVSLTVDE